MELSASYKLACLTCSFSDKELGEYFQHKKRRAGSIPLKYAVSHVGLQEDGTWVLGSSAYFKSSGEEETLEGSHHVWIGNIFRGTGVASATQQCSIQFPLTAKPLSELLHALCPAMAHNFFPCVITMAGMISKRLPNIFAIDLHFYLTTGAVMSLHYQLFIQSTTNCPVTLAYGSSGTGKTTAIHCGLGLMSSGFSTTFHQRKPLSYVRLPTFLLDTMTRTQNMALASSLWIYTTGHVKQQ